MVCDFIDCFSKSKNIVGALRCLGFQWHPKISNMLEYGPHRDLHRGLRKAIVAILYHVDRETLFQQLPDVYASVPAAPHGAKPWWRTALMQKLLLTKTEKYLVVRPNQKLCRISIICS